jgi:threonine aldolase
MLAVLSIRKENIHFPVSKLLCLENTHNRAGGSVIPKHHIDRLCDLAHSKGLKVHLDGARLFNAVAALNCDVKDLVANVDSIQFCLSKGLGAPIGSMLVGPAEFIQRARHLRKMLGGGMRQVGVIAAAGLIALREGPSRLQEDHDNCKLLAELLKKVPGVELDVAKVQTNMLYISTASSRTPEAAKWAAELKQRGVLSNATGEHAVRFVTHLDVKEADIRHAADVILQVGELFNKQ